jgi:hypothetical protein
MSAQFKHSFSSKVLKRNADSRSRERETSYERQGDASSAFGKCTYLIYSLKFRTIYFFKPELSFHIISLARRLYKNHLTALL